MISDVRCEQVDGLEFEIRWVFTAEDALLEQIHNKIKSHIKELFQHWRNSMFPGCIPSQGEYGETWAWGYLGGMDELGVEVNLDAGTFTIVLENKRDGDDALDYTSHEPNPLAWIDALNAVKKVIE